MKHPCLIRDRRLLRPKTRGGVPSRGYSLNAPVHGGQAEEKRAFQTGRIHPV
ncbi:hypothetical protein [Bacteroides sp. KG156]|uniref:hypothetical protein n=1 Tax=Bacteroides sp. KG156 TaxID=3397828 RepID=UPI003D96AF9E